MSTTNLNTHSPNETTPNLTQPNILGLGRGSRSSEERRKLAEKGQNPGGLSDSRNFRGVSFGDQSPSRDPQSRPLFTENEEDDECDEEVDFPRRNMYYRHFAGGSSEPKLRFTDMMPSVFLGCESQNAQNFFTKYRDYCRLHRLSEDECVDRFAYCVGDVVRKWFDDARLTINSLDELQQKFLNKFDALHSRSAIFDALDKKKYVKGQSIVKFVADIQDLVARLHLPSECVKDYFIKGMPGNIKAALAVIKKQPLDEIMEVVESIVETSSREGNSSSVERTQYPSQEFALLAMDLTEMKNAIQDIKEEGRKTRQEFRNIPSNQANEKRGNSADNRGRSGNNYANRNPINRRSDSNNFRVQNNNNSAGRSDNRNAVATKPRCFYCNREGHLLRDCFDLNRAYNNRRGSARSGRGGFRGSSRRGGFFSSNTGRTNYGGNNNRMYWQNPENQFCNDYYHDRGQNYFQHPLNPFYQADGPNGAYGMNPAAAVPSSNGHVGPPQGNSSA
jgi:hypothetical protein